MCSEYGFYVIGEADMESHGMAMRYGNHSNENYADAADDPQFGEAILDRMQRSVIRGQEQRRGGDLVSGQRERLGREF